MATSLGLNERLFVVDPQEVHELVGTGRLPEPEELWDQEAEWVLGGWPQRSEGGVCLWLLLSLHGEQGGMAIAFGDDKGEEGLAKP